MPHSMRNPTHVKTAPLYSLLLIAAFVLIALITIRAADQRVEPQARANATTHEHGMPMLGTLAGG